MSKVSLERIFAPIPEVERGKRFIIKSDPKGEKLIYCVANSVIIRDINNPGKCEEITYHAKKATAAAYSPSGAYICSGDITGTIKIWIADNEEHNQKYEFRVLGGSVEDICWTSDSKRIIIVGDGKEKYGSAISWDTGTSVGNLIGHNKRCLTCDVRQQRPMSVVTAGEDHSILQFCGPPFKYKATYKEHGSFINCIKFSPDGSRIASCAQNGTIWISDAINMEERYELLDGDKKPHNGGIYGISWSPDGKFLLSASGDRTCKIWNIDEKKCETIFTMGSSLQDQQLGCLWVNDHIISVSLSGKINFLNRNNPSSLLRYFWGHNRSVMCMITNNDMNYILSGSCDGHINRWNIETGDCELIEGAGFTTQVSDMDACGGTLCCCGLDDKIRFVSINDKKYMDLPPVELATQPQRVIMLQENLVAVGTLSDIVIISNNAITSTVSTKYSVKGLTVRYGSTGSTFTIAAGGENKHVVFYKVENNKISIDETLKPIEIPYDISYLRYSPNGKFLAVCTSTKLLLVYNADTMEIVDQWSGHSNRVSCVSWRPDSCYLVTCGVDSNMNVWCKDERFFRIENRNAHKSYSIPSIVWLKDDVIATVSQQGYSFKFWKVQI